MTHPQAHSAPPAGSAPPPARPEVETLQAYSAPLEGRRGLLRLDFNENTVGPSPKVVAAIRTIAAEEYAIYPEYDGLREAVIASLGGPASGLTPAQVGLFNGVDAALHACFHAYGAAGERLLTTSPTFGYYTPCARMQGMAIEAIPHLLPGFLFPFDEIRAARAIEPPACCCSATPTTPPAPALRRRGCWSWRPQPPTPWWWWMSSTRPSPVTACCRP